MTTLQSLVDGAIDELKEQAQDARDIGDLIHEIADWWVPIYTHTILEVASSKIRLAFDEPELWPAFNGKPTPVNLIAANIYEAIVEALRDRYEKHPFIPQNCENDT